MSCAAADHRVGRGHRCWRRAGTVIDVAIVTGAPRLRRSAIAVLALCCCLTVAGFAAGMHLLNVHRFYGVWAWTPPAKTASIGFHGRRYLRGGAGTSDDLAGCVLVGTAPGHGAVFTWPAPAGASTTGVWVRYPDGTILGYALSGGP
jgi:hypothetical protein